VPGADPVCTEKRCGLPWTGMIAGLLYLTARGAGALVAFVLSLTHPHLASLAAGAGAALPGGAGHLRGP
jgi:hypothetical protein